MQIARNGASADQDAGLHISFHCVPGEVGAGDEANRLVGDGDLRVNFASRELVALVRPRTDVSGRKCSFHLADRVEGDSATVLLAQFQ